MSSMSVHSLIDKFQQKGQPPSNAPSNAPTPKLTPIPPGGDIRGPKKRPSPTEKDQQEQFQQQQYQQYQQQYQQFQQQSQQQQQQQQQQHQQQPPQPPQPPPQINPQQQLDAGPLSLLGPNVLSFPLSENAYIEALKLKTEQERTKQEFYRLEIVSKNLSILQNALRAQIPGNLIPMMCVGGVPLPVAPGQSQQGPQVQGSPLQQTPTQKRGASPVGEFQKGHSRSNSRTNHSVDFNANPVPALNYRFGSAGTAPVIGGSPTPSMTPTSNLRRPLSPAKIGAAAVANLSTPITPYRASSGPTVMGNTSNTRRSSRYSQHQRHYSMPVESPNRINLGRVEQHSQKIKQQQQQTQPQTATGPNTPNLNYVIPPAITANRTSPLTTTMQVKPLPAQPLHKQSKSAQPPSQESMTSFQHIIQFHHWKPESGGQVGPVGNIGGSNPFRHKRQKSGSDNMSIDLGSPAQVVSSRNLQPSQMVMPLKSEMSTMVTSTPIQSRSTENDTIDDDKKDETMDLDEEDIDNTTLSDHVSKVVPTETVEVSMIERGGAITETEETDVESEQSEPVDPAAGGTSTGPSTASGANKASAPRGHRRGSSNVGRYPHDILSPYTK